MYQIKFVPSTLTLDSAQVLRLSQGNVLFDGRSRVQVVRFTELMATRKFLFIF